MKIFFRFKGGIIKEIDSGSKIFLKKYFVRKEKGCIFALAFEGKRQYIERDEKREIACVRGRDRGFYCRYKTSQEGKETSNSYNEEFDPGSG